MRICKSLKSLFKTKYRVKIAYTYQGTLYYPQRKVWWLPVWKYLISGRSGVTQCFSYADKAWDYIKQLKTNLITDRDIHNVIREK